MNNTLGTYVRDRIERQGHAIKSRATYMRTHVNQVLGHLSIYFYQRLPFRMFSHLLQA